MKIEEVLKLLESVQIEYDSVFASENNVVKPVLRIHFN